MRSNRSIPAAMVIPVLSYPDPGAAAAWLVRAFGFAVRLRIGNHRIQLRWGEGALVAAEGPAAPGAFSVLVRVEDAVAHRARAEAAGAVVTGPVTEYPYGERQYTAIDPAGYRWTFSETTRDADPAEWGGEWRESEA